MTREEIIKEIKLLEEDLESAESFVFDLKDALDDLYQQLNEVSNED